MKRESSLCKGNIKNNCHYEGFLVAQRLHLTQATKCGNCLESFTAIRKKQGIVILSNVVATCPVFSFYVLCTACRDRFNTWGEAGIPHARDDARLAALTMAMPVGGAM